MTGIELDLITKAESATKQRKQKRSDTEPTIRNIARTSSSNAVATMNSAPVPAFVEGGVVISFEDRQLNYYSRICICLGSSPS